MAHAPDPRYFDAKPPKLKESLWPSEGPGMKENYFYLCNMEANGKKICWGTVIERK